MKKLAEIPADGKKTDSPDWEAFTENYKQAYPEKYAEKVASGEWEKQKKLFSGNISKS